MSLGEVVTEDRKERLKAIEDSLKFCHDQKADENEWVEYYQTDISWLVDELRASWERERLMRNSLREILAYGQCDPIEVRKE